MLHLSSHTIWLFDYDLTLYGFEEQGVLDALDVNITAFVSQHLHLEKAAANQLRKEYCRDFGTTLGGLQAHHGVAPHAYFDFIHHRGDLRMPKPDAQKKALLKSLPGTLYVFTNARKDWAERGIAAMGLTDCFAGLFDLEMCDWQGKPALSAYQHVEAALHSRGHAWQQSRELVLLDDKPENLSTARELGWSTVLVHPEAEKRSEAFDLGIRHLLDLQQALL